MNDVLQVRLGPRRAANWRRFLKQTGLNQAEVIRAAVDAHLKEAGSGLPTVVARWAGKVKGRGVTATNDAVARELGR